DTPVVRLSRAGSIAAIVLVALVISAAAIPSIRERILHRRDAGAFNDYVSTYIDGWRSSRDPGGQRRDKAWALAHPNLVLAEGDQACAWLEKQPDAGQVDPSGATSVDGLIGAY